MLNLLVVLPSIIDLQPVVGGIADDQFLLEISLILSLLLCLLYARRTRELHQDIHDTTADLYEQIDRHRQEIQRLRAMLDGLDVPVWYRDRNLKLAECNRAYVEAVETPKSTILRDDIEIVTPSSQQLYEYISPTSPARTEHYYTIIQGQRRFVAITERLFGEHRIGFALDKSDTDAQQRELQEYLESQTSLIENLSTAVAVFDATTHLKFFNRAYAQMSSSDEKWLRTGPTLGEVLEDLRARRQLPEYADFAAYKRQRLSQFTAALVQPEEDLVHRPDGRTWRMVTAPYPMGGLMYMFEDVTDKLSLERQNNTLVAVKREAFNNLYEGIIIFGSDHRLKIINPAFIKVWHLEETPLTAPLHLNEVITHMAPNFLDDTERQRHRDLFTNMFAERHPSWGRIHCREEQVIDFKYVPLPDGAHMLGFIDTTDQYKVEQALRERNQALIAADELKSQFLMHVSYELRTPLNTILGFSEILQQGYFGALAAKQEEYVQGIHHSSQQLLKLINDILDITTIESEHFFLELQEVDIAALVRSIETLMQKRVYEAGLALLVECPEDIGGCYADERRLRQVLYNMVSNSMKFTRPGGKIIVSARRNQEYMVLSVEDNGLGVNPDDHHRIFEKFERSATASTNIQGPGLGLALVKSIIERHGGHLSIESAPGVGTKIECHIPAFSQNLQG